MLRYSAGHYDWHMAMQLEQTRLEPVAILTRQVFTDERGSFSEVGKQSEFDALGLPRFVQTNESRSRRGVLRGLHYQLDPHAQGKLVRVVVGSVWDVAVDIRKSSPTFLEWFALELDADAPTMVWVPRGFAHGFLTLTDDAIVQYTTTAEYHEGSERIIAWNDPAIGIDWPNMGEDVVLSSKDSAAPDAAETDVFG
jgi:dTDP-4-dehydrorhamnose 3,5-epimerase